MRVAGILALAATVAAQQSDSTLNPSIVDLSQHFVGADAAVQVAKNVGGQPQTLFQVPDAEWVRVSFDYKSVAKTMEGEDFAVTITSDLDGHSQTLNATTLKQWYYTSAYFNGDSVSITYDSKSHMIPLKGAMVGDKAEGQVGVQSICDGRDDRVPSNSRRDARYLGSGGCSGWIFRDDNNDEGHCFMTAGHCGTNSQGSGTMQFQVPLSTPSGGMVHPGPEDQYSVDASSVQGANNGVGNDWMYLGTFPNSETGLSALEAQGDAYELSFTAPSTSGTATITGYGTTSPRDQYSQAQQTHSGSVTSNSGSSARYRPDTTGGNSGSAVESSERVAYAVHTHGGCSSSGGSNAGTLLSSSNVQNALANPRGVCGGNGSEPPPPTDPSCTNSCIYAFDIDCDDGGSGSDYNLCSYGSDCSDCCAKSPSRPEC